jgi:hypothetical protein
VATFLVAAALASWVMGSRVAETAWGSPSRGIPGAAAIETLSTVAAIPVDRPRLSNHGRASGGPWVLVSTAPVRAHGGSVSAITSAVRLASAPRSASPIAIGLTRRGPPVPASR